ncbi:cupin domain-containing protein [Streptomyces malaysiensis]|uniref:cupin domain-containing protein n=1 Tax=Streptomyces malaysiensis TaxID=92644 RepID=UPI0038514FD9
MLVTAGRCRVEAGTDVVDLAKGDAVIIPPHIHHGFRAICAQTAAVTAILSSPDAQTVWHTPPTIIDP